MKCRNFSNYRTTISSVEMDSCSYEKYEELLIMRDIVDLRARRLGSKNLSPQNVHR